jgi:serine/threonine protein kinase
MKSMSKKRLKEGKNNNKVKVDNEVALLKIIDHPGIV